MKQLRQAPDAAGFQQTQIVLPDGWDCSGVVKAAQADPLFNASIYGVGLHYPCKSNCDGAIALGH
ncbi:hypothetical protein, partial [Vibrio cholerae]|uniref:hypothetical protein n=1 Tax=Vibrio cholerae TaxID=666 RepID=UPI0018F0D95C